MKIWKKNMVAAAVLVTVCAGIYVNWLYTEENAAASLVDTLDTEKVMSEDALILSEDMAAIASGEGVSTTASDYFAAVRLSRQQARDSAVNLLQEAMAYSTDSVGTKDTESAMELEDIVQTALSEAQIESLPTVSRAIDDMFKSEGNALPTAPLIISQVCKFYNVDEAVIRGTQKNKGTAEARQVAMYLIRKLTNLSLPDIGKEFARDHSTVLYAIRKVEVALKNGDSNMQNNIRDITANINSCL